MTESDLLEHIFERLCRADSGEEIFGADEAAQWPGGALEVLIKSGLLGRAEPAQVIECDGCERSDASGGKRAGRLGIEAHAMSRVAPLDNVRQARAGCGSSAKLSEALRDAIRVR